LIVDIDDSDGEDKQERGEDEQDRRGESAKGPSLEVPDPHDDLRREWSGHRLSEGDAIEEVRRSEPPSALDEIPLHVADRRDRSAEPPRAQANEVPKQPGERRRSRLLVLGRYRGLAHLSAATVL